MSETEPTQPVATCDVFVLGGGPAGSTIATLLAQRGWQVVVAEKEHHPRFHIGESLLPLNLPLFERLGVSGPDPGASACASTGRNSSRPTTTIR